VQGGDGFSRFAAAILREYGYTGGMHTTPLSLLERLRQPADAEAWTRFVRLYTPLLCAWARRAGLRGQDAADLVQDVLLVLVQKLPDFRYDPHRSFRAWLRTVTLNKWREGARRRGLPVQPGGAAALDEVAAPDAAALFEETEYRRHVVGRALQLIRDDFQPATWKAWCEHGLAGRPVDDVARELDVTPKAVYLAKARVLRRLREELAGLLD
jgi:RNA polymerase sigma-70 factor (ECF subfamily)